MDTGLPSSPPGPVQGGWTGGRQAAHSNGGATAASRRPGALRRAFTVVRDYLPRGNTLDDETFRSRHRLLCWVLGLHVPTMFVYGVWLDYGVSHSAVEVVIPIACLVFARLSRNRRLAAFFVTAGLVYCSSALVHLSGGVIEAHFHFFIIIGLIALYQDWVPFAWNVVFTVLSHGVGSAIAADIIFNHDAGQNRPWHWAFVHGVAVLAACVGVVIFWKNTEQEQQRNVALVASMAATEAAQREAVSDLLVNLARRNQSLLNRQLGLINDLEQREREPEVLAELFRLDHLATRIRRNAESLLVLSGDEAPRRWGKPVPLSEVVRAAAAEVEDYRRVDVAVNDHLEVAGRAVADLAHLVAELLENATSFSPPTQQVLVRSHLAAGEPRAFVISIEDSGLGMSEEDLRRANELLAHAPEVDLGRASMLGFHVVARLAARYGIHVTVGTTPGGGVTALVRLPADLVGERTGALGEWAEQAPAGPAHVQPAHAEPAHIGPAHAEPAHVGARPQWAEWPEDADAGGAVRVVTPAEVVASAGVVRGPDQPIATGLPQRPPPPGLGGVPSGPARDGTWRPRLSEPIIDVEGAPARMPAPGPFSPPGQPTPSGQPTPPPPPPPPAPPPPAAPPSSSRPASAPPPPPGAPVLAQRVPGASLAPSLRRGGGPASAGGNGSAPTLPTPPPWAAAGPAGTSGHTERDPARVGSMLSRFQSGQRAGRAVSTLPPSHATERQPRSPEEDR